MSRNTRAAVRRRNSARATHAPPARSLTPAGLSRGGYRKISFFIDIPIRRKDRRDRTVSPSEDETSVVPPRAANMGPFVAARHRAAESCNEWPTLHYVSDHNLSDLEVSSRNLSKDSLSSHDQPENNLLPGPNCSDSDLSEHESSDLGLSDHALSDSDLSDDDLFHDNQSDPTIEARLEHRSFETKYSKWFREARRRSCSGAMAPQYGEKIHYQWVKDDEPDDLEGMKAVVLDEVKKLCICYSDILMLGTVIKAALPAINTDGETFGRLFHYGKSKFYKLRLDTLWKNAYVSVPPHVLPTYCADSCPEKLAHSWLRDTDPGHQTYQGICTGPRDHAALSAADQRWLEARFDLRSFHAVFGWCQKVLDDSAVQTGSTCAGVRWYLRQTFGRVMVMVGRVAALEMGLEASRTGACSQAPPDSSGRLRARKEREAAGMKFYSLGITDDGEGPEWRDFPWKDTQRSQRPSFGNGRSHGSREAQQRARDFAKNPAFTRMTNILYLSPSAAPGSMPPRCTWDAEGEQARLPLDRAAPEHAVSRQSSAERRCGASPPHLGQGDSEGLLVSTEVAYETWWSLSSQLAVTDGGLERVRKMVCEAAREWGPAEQQTAVQPTLPSDADILCSLDPALHHAEDHAGQATDGMWDEGTRSDYPVLLLEEARQGASFSSVADRLCAKKLDRNMVKQDDIHKRPVKAKKGRPGIRIPGTCWFPVAT